MITDIPMQYLSLGILAVNVCQMLLTYRMLKGRGKK
jgi:hypothetical protein